jgi:predicted  nucleic acid-binding Zn-ribbon protein
MLSNLLVSLYEFKQFLQIVLWIAIPATILSVLITVFLHYRRRQKKYALEPVYQESGLQLAMSQEPGTLPDWLASSNPDNASLLKKYEREVRKYREDYATLEQDFKQLEEKYADLLNKAYHSGNKDDGQAERLHQEIKGYKLRITQLQQALEARQHDERTGEQPAADRDQQLSDLQQMITRLKEENTELSHRLAEQDYLQDIVEEKKLQTDFLQNQLEQRIKGYHHIELQVNEWKQAAEHAREENKHQEETIVSLQQTIAQEQQRYKELEYKLEQSNQLLFRIHAELNSSMPQGIVSHHQVEDTIALQ